MLAVGPASGRCMQGLSGRRTRSRLSSDAARVGIRKTPQTHVGEGLLGGRGARVDAGEDDPVARGCRLGKPRRGGHRRRAGPPGEPLARARPPPRGLPRRRWRAGRRCSRRGPRATRRALWDAEPARAPVQARGSWWWSAAGGGEHRGGRRRCRRGRCGRGSGDGRRRGGGRHGRDGRRGRRRRRGGARGRDADAGPGGAGGDPEQHERTGERYTGRGRRHRGRDSNGRPSGPTGAARAAA